jgi:hypothetical protein
VNDYIVNPNKRYYTDLDYFVRVLFEKLPENATYIDDDSRAYYPVEFYYRFYNMRRDLALLVFNSWDIPNWGITPKEIHSRFDRLLEGRPGRIFLVSVDRPFARVIDQYQKKSKIKFERFPIDDNKWIYEAVLRDPVEAEVAKDQIVRLGQWHDFSTDMIVSRRSIATLSDQEMYSFGPDWEDGNQAFVRVEKDGGYVEFAFKSQKVSNVQLNLFFATAPDFGNVQVSLDGRVLGDSIDLNADEVSRKSYPFVPVDLEEGEHRLRFTIDAGQKFVAFGVDGMTLTHPQ